VRRLNKKIDRRKKYDKENKKIKYNIFVSIDGGGGVCGGADEYSGGRRTA
jgi:hypothetical protein